MSKLYAKVFMWENTIDKMEFRETYSQIEPKVKYLLKTKEFRFKTFDAYSFFRWHVKEPVDFKIAESDIFRYFRFDKLYSDTPIDDMPSREIKEIEKNDDMPDKDYMNLCFLQHYYFFSKGILKLVKRQMHVYRLHRADDMWFHLQLIPINRQGGRIAGGKFAEPKYLSKEEKEILLDNLSRYDAIVAHYAASDVSLEKFIYMHKQLSKLGTLLPKELQKSFMRRDEGLTWYWHSIRYNWKVEHGGELNPTLEEILDAQKKYGFPFEPKGKNKYGTERI